MQFTRWLPRDLLRYLSTPDPVWYLTCSGSDVVVGIATINALTRSPISPPETPAPAVCCSRLLAQLRLGPCGSAWRCCSTPARIDRPDLSGRQCRPTTLTTCAISAVPHTPAPLAPAVMAGISRLCLQLRQNFGPRAVVTVGAVGHSFERAGERPQTAHFLGNCRRRGDQNPRTDLTFQAPSSLPAGHLRCAPLRSRANFRPHLTSRAVRGHLAAPRPWSRASSAPLNLMIR